MSGCDGVNDTYPTISAKLCTERVQAVHGQRRKPSQSWMGPSDEPATIDPPLVILTAPTRRFSPQGVQQPAVLVGSVSCTSHTQAIRSAATDRWRKPDPVIWNSVRAWSPPDSDPSLARKQTPPPDRTRKRRARSRGDHAPVAGTTGGSSGSSSRSTSPRRTSGPRSSWINCRPSPPPTRDSEDFVTPAAHRVRGLFRSV